MEDITERFISVYQLLKTQKLIKNDADFARKLDVTPSAISNIMAGTSKAQIKIVQGIAKSFTMVNLTWLLIGQGEMINKTASSQLIKKEDAAKPLENNEDIITLLHEIKSEQAKGFINLKSILQKDGIVPGKQNAEPSHDDLERQVEELRAKLNSGELEIRNKPLKGKSHN